MPSPSHFRLPGLGCALLLGVLVSSVSCARDRATSTAGTPPAASDPAGSQASKAAEQLLLDAFVAEFGLGDTRSVATYDLGNGNKRTVVRLVKIIDDYPCGRIETTVSGPRAPDQTFVVVTTREGSWELFPDAAIRLVNLIPTMREAISAGAGRERLQANRFVAEPRIVDGKRYLCVTAFFSDETRLAIAAQTAAMMKGRGITVSSALAMTPQRREHLIDDDLKIVTSQKNFSSTGALLEESRIDRIEAHLNLPAELFTIPAEVRRYYPQTDQEFRSLATDAFIRAQTLSPRTTPGLK